jgi:predicted nucleotidyltransferase
MRLNSNEIEIIKKCFHAQYGEQDHLWLFGSRVNDEARGGDIDLYIETKITNIREASDKKFEFLLSLNMQLGEQKIDIVQNILSLGYEQLIYNIAKKTGVQLV